MAKERESVYIFVNSHKTKIEEKEGGIRSNIYPAKKEWTKLCVYIHSPYFFYTAFEKINISIK